MVGPPGGGGLRVPSFTVGAPLPSRRNSGQPHPTMGEPASSWRATGHSQSFHNAPAHTGDGPSSSLQAAAAAATAAVAEAELRRASSVGEAERLRNAIRGASFARSSRGVGSAMPASNRLSTRLKSFTRLMSFGRKEAPPPEPEPEVDPESSGSSSTSPLRKIRPTVEDLYENGDSDDDMVYELDSRHRSAAITASLCQREDLRIVGPMKYTTIGRELKPPRYAYIVAPFFKIYAFIMTMLYIALSIAPILLAVFVFKVNWHFSIVALTMTVMILTVSVPFFYMIVQWQPLDTRPVHQYRMRTADILLTTYMEDMEIIINTLNAIQRINYSPKFLSIYVLDDGRRSELGDFCELMNSKDPKYPITYVTRPNNRGRKGGNINHFIREYEDVASEWFIVLDADMAPFPEIFDVLFGSYYSHPKEERDRIAFIQCPQHFKNHIPSEDWYDIGMAFFYTCVMACMSSLGCTMYIGTCALWRRSAIVFGGGFHEAHATEDTVTGCYIHRTQVDLLDPEPVNWTSKFINIPIAAGIAPGTLPQQIDQRLRWCLGSVQMFYEHGRFITAVGLTFNQKMAYFATVGYWVLGMASFFSTVTASITVLLWIIIRGILFEKEPSAFPFWLLVLQFFSFTLYFMTLPVAKQVDKLRVVQMFSVFTPVYIVAYLRYRGVNIKVQTTAAESDEDTRKWHPFFFFHFTVLAIMTTLGGLAIGFGGPTPTNIATALCHSLYWWIIYFPVLLSLSGFKQERIHPRYIREDDENPNMMFEVEVPSESEDGITESRTESPEDSRLNSSNRMPDRLESVF